MQEKNHIVLRKAEARVVDAQRVLPGKQEEDDHDVLNQLFYLRNMDKNVNIMLYE